MTLSLTFRLWSGENQIVRVGNRSGRITWSKCTFPHFVLPPLLPPLPLTLTFWFSPDHKRNVSDRVVKEIGTLFSLDHTLYTSDYDSDSVTSEWFAVLKWIAVCVPFISRSKLSAVWTAQAICLKNLSAIQTAWAICAKTLLSFPKSGVICICLKKKNYPFKRLELSFPICVVNLFSKAMSTRIRTIF